VGFDAADQPLKRSKASMKIRTILYCSLFLVAASTLLAANGSKGKKVIYEAHIRIGDATQPECHFLVELEPILFQINTVQNKYRVIRINIRNESQAPLKLSLDKDSVQVRAGSHLIKGSLSLASSDQAWWDGLSPELRKALAYPDQSTIKRGEEENVFVFVSDSDLPKLPVEILFKIDSVSATPIPIRERGVAAAKS
jgi:flagellar basal body-associated protein FliL